MFTNSPFPIDTAVIRSSLLAILCKVSVLTNFPKFTRKHLRFFMKFSDLQVLINFIKKEISAPMFSCEFCEISHSTFFNEPFGWLLLPKNLFCLLFHHYFLPFQTQHPTYCPAEYFPGLIRKLEIRVSSISQIFSQESEAYFQPSQTL